MSIHPVADAPKYRTLNAFTDAEWQQLDVAHQDTRKVTGAIPPPKPWDTDPEPRWQAIFRRATSGEANVFEGNCNNDQGKSAALRLHAKALVVAVAMGARKVMCLDRADAASLAAVRKAWDEAQSTLGGALHIAAQTDLFDLTGMGREVEGKE